ncbi:MAG: DUF3237 domain-containing protein [Caldilineaceae bacterium]
MTTLEPVQPQLEHLLRATVTVATPLLVGAIPLGERRIINITGGHFSGAKLRGAVLPGGADWQLVRPDGAALLEARYTLHTDDGALIYVTNRGIRHGPPEVLARIARGELVDPALYYFRATPSFETGAEPYRWLNDVIAVCSGVRTAEAVLLDFYVLT